MSAAGSTSVGDGGMTKVCSSSSTMSFSEDVGADIVPLLWFRNEDAQIRGRERKEMKGVVHDSFDSYSLQSVVLHC
jgi:hypothetical protein